MKVLIRNESYRERLQRIRGYDMPLHDRYTQATVFLTAPDPNTGKLEPIGTGFVVRLRGSLSGEEARYLVTARHVVHGRQGKTHVRLRFDNDGDLDSLGIVIDDPVGSWTYHPSDPVKADVAVSHFVPPGKPKAQRWAHTSIDIRVNEMGRHHEPLSLGEEAYFVGLLGHVKEMGKRVVPMVRSGTLGAWDQPEIPVRLEDGSRRMMRGHLLDARSYLGFSGSPCFINPSKWTRWSRKSDPFDLTRSQSVVSRPTSLIGMIAGHMEVGEALLSERGEPLPVYQAQNVGVAVVTPVERIIETLNEEDLVVAMKNIEEELNEPRRRFIERGTIPDSTEGTRGPEPERLQSDETLDELAKRVMDAGKPDDWDEDDD